MAYLTFLSNYDKEIYEWNQPSSFCNSLAEPLMLEEGGSYEIALAELSYCNNHIIKAEDITLKVFDWLHLNTDKVTYGALITLKLSHSIINNAIDLCNVINSLIWGVVPRFDQKKYKFFTFENNRRIWANFTKNMYLTIILDARLLIMMGITKTDKKGNIVILGDTKDGMTYIYNGETRHFKETRNFASVLHTKDFFRFLPQIPISQELLLYTDLVKSNHVANNMINLLKIVPLKTQRDVTAENERIVISYGSDRVYRPLVARNIIKEANFTLRSLAGNLVDLEGYLRILVHIRRSNITP